MAFTVVSFTTGGIYNRHILELRQTVETLGVPFASDVLPDLGAWVLNCAQKGPFVARMLRELGTDVLWIDADGRLLQYPEFIATLDAQVDFAVATHSHGKVSFKPAGREQIKLPMNWPASVEPRWFNSGTVFIRRSEMGTMLAQRWADLCEESPRDYDQWSLQQAWCDVLPTTAWLGRSYCQIRGPRGKAVVYHHLASVEGRVDRR